MKLVLLSVATLLFPLLLTAQSASLSGQLQDDKGVSVAFANIALYRQADTTLVKVETTDEDGKFVFQNLPEDQYMLEATYVGLDDLRADDIQVEAGKSLDLGVLTFVPMAVELETALVTAQRALVEVKPDRTVFNVEGTINSAGGDGLSLLRKAPGVTVDNNNNVNMLGRAGVRIYIDGKPLPLVGEDLANYLQNLTAAQIDRIDIISNPGARYEAEGNAGIIDIRLKRDKNMGANGSVSTSYSQGQYGRFNLNTSGTYRNRKISAFATAGVSDGTVFTRMNFDNYQNDLFLDEYNFSKNHWQNASLRGGLDFFLSTQHTIGALVTGRIASADRIFDSRTSTSRQATPNQLDSVLIAGNNADVMDNQSTYNLNYRFDNGNGTTLNLDADYGRYRNDRERDQPNQYYDATEQILLSEVNNYFVTPTDIDITTLKLDFETEALGGKLGAGSKFSQVVTANTFLFYNLIDNDRIFNDARSNLFDYDEKVYAGYVNFDRALGEKWKLVLGLRAEQTDSYGELTAFRDELEEEAVDLNYLNWFPNAGLTWQVSPQNTLAFNYGRRINRPNYQRLNPFDNQVSELSYEKGNPFLRPEIVNNFEIGYTLAYRYNFKLAYSLTTDQITRLLGPDDEDPRAGFISWANLAEQKIISFNISAPIQVTKGWNAYFNLSGSYTDNQADYGEGAIVDVQAWSYNIYQQQSFDLPAGFKGEVSGWFSGPGVWGGVFEYETSFSLNLGLQKKFLNDQLNAKLSANDIFYETGWDGFSKFDGLTSVGSGRWDSRTIALSLSYNFGNQNVKRRNRKTGLEDESKRIEN